MRAHERATVLRIMIELCLLALFGLFCLACIVAKAVFWAAAASALLSCVEDAAQRGAARSKA